jgi:hypothetical protein
LLGDGDHRPVGAPAALSCLRSSVACRRAASRSNHNYHSGSGIPRVLSSTCGSDITPPRFTRAPPAHRRPSAPARTVIPVRHRGRVGGGEGQPRPCTRCITLG